MLYECTFTVSKCKNNNVRQHSYYTSYAVTLSTVKPLYVIKVFYSPMNVQVIVLQTILKFT